ncbi:MAG: dihydrolipoyl dehydrogenase family protein [Desulfovibrio sp.]|uniref:dihydrolipoyl dehydrogenase family protein n=1 Tax=Desulfovibrio sp. 7SRBS1 TaxID=3378064 RepID=UPI003B3EC94C
MHDFDLGIIGGGAAGLTAASGAAQLGVKTLLLDAGPALGGDCLHYGCVPSKTLLHTARVRHLMAHANDVGLPGTDLPPVDFSRVRERIAQVIATIQQHDSVERFCKLGAQVRFARPEFVDEHSVETHTQDGHTERISAARWLIATGSSPFVPDIPGLHTSGQDKATCLTNKEIFSLDSLPESLVILGGGAIAVEMAQAFVRLGSRVDVVQRGKQILSGEDPDLAAQIQAALEAEGVRFHLGATVDGVHSEGGLHEIHLHTEDGKQLIRSSHLLAAMGRTPNLEGLGLDAAGIAVAAHGIQVDSRLRTAQPHIYAAGDVTGQYQFTHAAGYEGGVVVTNAVFRLPRTVDYTWMPHCIYCDPELAGAGLNETQAKAAGIEYKVHVEKFSDNDRALAENSTRGYLKLLLDRKDKPLGVRILGPRAGDILSEWVAVLNGGVRLSSLASAVHPYPTLAEINKRAAGNIIAPKIFSGTVKKGLKFFFNYKGRACEYESSPDATNAPEATSAQERPETQKP